jgi:bifunctional DNase/RNase
MIEMIIDSIRVSLMNYQRVVILKEKIVDDVADELAKRYLPIWIGPAEADAIAVKLQDVNVPRPLTHDLLRSVIGNLGVTIGSIIVNDLKNDTFYATIILDVGQLISGVKFEKRFEHQVEQEWVLFEWGISYRLLVTREFQEADKRFVEAQSADKSVIFLLCNTDDKWLVDKIYVDSRPSDALALAVRVGVPIYAEEMVLDKAGIFLDKETGKPLSPQKESETGKKVSEDEMKKMSAFYDFINTLDLDDFDKRKS